MSRRKRLFLIALVVALLPLNGCLTKRQKAVLWRQPSNRIWQLPAEPLADDQAASLAQYDQAGSQSLLVLRLAQDAKLGKRYHKAHDMTLFVAEGTGIVIVEETRYSISAGSAVFLPRHTAYAVEPLGKAQETLTALMVYSPAFDGQDVVLLK